MFKIEKNFNEILQLFSGSRTSQLLVEKAFNYAKNLHGEQRRKDGELYLSHPVEVALILANLGFNENVVCVGEEDGKLTVQSKETQIVNDIWDGQSLLDESLFTDAFKDKHMLLLRNKFFKTCGFKSKIQKWFLDNDIKDINQLIQHYTQFLCHHD